MTSRTDQQPPWKRKRPAQPAKKLTAKKRHAARARARAAGRTYPNLVDNMAVINTRKTRRRRSARKTSKGTSKAR